MENNIDKIIPFLEQVSETLINWIKNNFDKYHVIVNTNKPVRIKSGDYAVENIECEKLVGVKIDTNLNFNDHISYLC